MRIVVAGIASTPEVSRGAKRGEGVRPDFWCCRGAMRGGGASLRGDAPERDKMAVPITSGPNKHPQPDCVAIKWAGALPTDWSRQQHIVTGLPRCLQRAHLPSTVRGDNCRYQLPAGET